MILNLLSAAYGAAAVRRRRWYTRTPGRQARLSRPVVSVGNLRVGGAGKTPIVAHVARLLAAHGERPAVLTRGYGRSEPADGVTVVSDGDRILAGAAKAGDEPLMLARQLPGIPILVAGQRYLAGLLAERRFNASVHVLDDGFQHLPLARTLDLLLVDETDLSDRPIPAGRLREPLASASVADALLVTASYPTAAERVARTLGVPTVFRVTRSLGAPRLVTTSDSVVVPPGARVFTAAAIARPERFEADVASAGWQVVGSMAFRDHHWFSAQDIDRLARAAKSAAAAIVLTTEKDAVRFAACDLRGLPMAAVPLIVTVDPAEEFARWLVSRIREARR